MHIKKIPRNAVKEAFDHLPSGICFFNAKGLPILCNHTMHKIMFALTGHDLQSLPDLLYALDASPNDGRYIREGDLYLLPDGTAWQFTSKRVQTEGAYYIEYVAANVSELYKSKQELQKSTAEHEKMIDNMKKIVDNVTAITREEEVLTMKMQIHGQVGVCLQRLRRYHVGGCPEAEKQEVVKELQNVVKSLKGEIGNTDEIDVLAELLRVASALGVTVSIDGVMPVKSQEKNLVIMAMRECITNTLRHAQGNAVFVSIAPEEKYYRLVITNNGNAPAEPISEGGGLSFLRKKTEKIGGVMTVQSLPFFSLTILIPIESEEV